MAYNTYSGLYNSGIDQSFFDRTLLRNAQPSLVYGKDADKAALPRNNSNTVVFYQYNRLGKQCAPLQEGKTPDGLTMSRRTLSAQVKSYGAHVSITDIAANMLRGDPRIAAAELLGKQAGESLDAIMRDVFTSTTTRRIAGGKASRSLLTSTDTLSVDDIQQAMITLDDNMAYRFPDGCYHCITMPRGKLALQKDSDWQEVVDDSTHKQQKSGELGSVYGARFSVSQQGKVISPDKLTVKSVSSTAITLNEEVPAKIKNRYNEDIDNPLAGKLAVGKSIYVKGTLCTISAFTASTASNDAVVTVSSIPDGVAANDNIYTDDTTSAGIDVGVTLIYGAHAFAQVALEGGGIQLITHGLGSAGASDPLNLYATCAWKTDGFAAAVLDNAWAVAIEHAL